MVCPIHCPINDKEWKPPKTCFYFWSKAKLCRPKDHLKPEKCYRRKPFISVAQCSHCPPQNMFSILSHEYGRQQQSELQKFRERICQAQENHKQRLQKILKNNPNRSMLRPCVPTPQRFIMKRFQGVPARTCSQGIDIKLERKKGCVPRAPLPCSCDPKFRARCPCRRQ